MAMLLRQGARRIGGPVLQRTQAAVTSPAVSDERRRLVPRLMHTKERPSPKIQQMKEDLYEVLSETEKDLNTSTWGNRTLLQVLAAHVNPRPHDSLWRRMRISKTVNNCVETAGTVTLLSLATLFALAKAREKKMALTVEKQEHEELDGEPSPTDVVLFCSTKLS